MHTQGAQAARGRTSRWLVAAASCALLFLPGLAFVAGSRGEQIENRPPVEFSGFDEGWRSPFAFGQFLDDRLPLRERAVAADAWVDEHVFSEDPAFGGNATPRVIRGDDGVLFLADAFDAACYPELQIPVVVSNLDRLATIIAESGRNIVTMVAPDKSSIHPELLPDGLSKRECFDVANEALWSDLAAADIPGYFDLRAALIDESAESRELLYLRKDSHWDQAGSLVAVQQTVEQFAPGLWQDDEVVYRGLSEYTGDLTEFQGNPQVDQAPSYSVVRPDVRSVSVEQIDDQPDGFNKRYINEAPEGRLITGRTVMFFDSFGMAALHQLVPFFEDITVVRLSDFEADRFASLIADADNVWFLSVERSLGNRLVAEIGSTAFLDQLEIVLRQP